MVSVKGYGSLSLQIKHSTTESYRYVEKSSCITLYMSGIKNKTHYFK